MSNEKEFLTRKIAVTGATGMLGSHLVVEMVRAGYTDITLVVRNARKLSVLDTAFCRLGVDRPEGVVKVVEANLQDEHSLTQQAGGMDTVFNCAARIMSGDMTTAELIDNNVSITRAVTEWCLKSGAHKLIHVSSISALGEPATPDTPINEECVPESIEHYAAYGKSKYYSEQEVWRGEREGLQVVVLAPGVILGEGEKGCNNSASLPPAISCGQPFYTNGLMSYVDVRDVARAMVFLDSKPEAVGHKFILSAGDMSYKELMTLGAHTAKRPRPLIPIGKGAVSVAYGAMRFATALGLMKDNGVTKENLSSVLRKVRYDGSKIERMFGFRYTPLPETIERVVAACSDKKQY